MTNTSQTNVNSGEPTSEAKDNLQTNVNPPYNFKQIEDKLNQHSELLSKLSVSSEPVKPEGLAHLAEQSAFLAKAVVELKTALESDNSDLKKQVETIMNDFNKKNLELEKQNVINQYNLPKEVAELLDKVGNADELKTFAETLATVLESKSNIPTKLTVNKKVQSLPSHLKHLL